MKIRTRLLSLLMALVMVLALMPMTALAAEGDEDITLTTITETSTTWSGSMLAEGSVTINSDVYVHNGTILTLADGAVLTVNGSINGNPKTALTIYAGENGTGSLTVSGSVLSTGTDGDTAGTLTVHGGNITVNGGVANGLKGNDVRDLDSYILGRNGGKGGTVVLYGGHLEILGGLVMGGNGGYGENTSTGSSRGGHGGVGGSIYVYSGSLTADEAACGGVAGDAHINKGYDGDSSGGTGGNGGSIHVYGGALNVSGRLACGGVGGNVIAVNQYALSESTLGKGGNGGTAVIYGGSLTAKDLLSAGDSGYVDDKKSSMNQSTPPRTPVPAIMLPTAANCLFTAAGLP